jgi:hypothetical protein
MSTFKFTLPNGKPFEIKGPPSLSLEQAKAIFDKQAETGALVGIKPGEVLSAATQAAQGLASAQAIVAQAQSGIVGALGAGIPGAAGAIGALSGALGAAGGALGGSLAGTAAGLTGAVGAAVTNFSSVLSAGGVDLTTGRIAAVDAAFASGGLTAAAGALGTFTGALGGAAGLASGISSALASGQSLTAVAGSIGATASTAIGTINKSLASAVTDPIGIANFAKEIPALTSIGSMNAGVVTGVLAQAKNLVGQASDSLSVEKGLGAFGLGAEQLEKAGILKPGVSKLLAGGAASITSLLKSPAAFTGKDGIKSVTDLLSNPIKQAGIQQELMSQGVAGLKALGVPTDLLSPQGLAGTALNAAKSIPGAAAFLKGLPIPDDPAGALSAAFNANVRDGAFAANLSQAKIPPAFKAIVTPVPAADTVNRDTVDAAVTRVLGNPKIPEPNYGPPAPDPGADSLATEEIKRLSAELTDLIASTTQGLDTLNSNIAALETRQTITDAQWEALNAQRTALGTTPLIIRRRAALTETFNTASLEVKNAYALVFRRIQSGIEELADNAIATKNRVNELAKKRQGPPDNQGE